MGTAVNPVLDALGAAAALLPEDSAEGAGAAVDEEDLSPADAEAVDASAGADGAAAALEGVGAGVVVAAFDELLETLVTSGGATTGTACSPVDEGLDAGVSEAGVDEELLGAVVVSVGTTTGDAWSAVEDALGTAEDALATAEDALASAEELSADTAAEVVSATVTATGTASPAEVGTADVVGADEDETAACEKDEAVVVGPDADGASLALAVGGIAEVVAGCAARGELDDEAAAREVDVAGVPLAEELVEGTAEEVAALDAVDKVVVRGAAAEVAGEAVGLCAAEELRAGDGDGDELGVARKEEDVADEEAAGLACAEDSPVLRESC
ncbi:hypothetical protein BC628DRAFT_1196914 [Trametes gibbosa]|nr:hypothetical protein BC628DRAFT_1196914 [Trametes gibbosa]